MRRFGLVRSIPPSEGVLLPSTLLSVTGEANLGLVSTLLWGTPFCTFPFPFAMITMSYIRHLSASATTAYMIPPMDKSVLPTLPTRTRRPTKTYYSLRAIQPRFDILGVHAVCPILVYRKLCYRDFYILMLMVYRGSDKPAVAKVRESTRFNPNTLLVKGGIPRIFRQHEGQVWDVIR